MTPTFSSFQQQFESLARQHFAHRRAEANDVAELMDSIEYSLYNGGKRFRPMLCYSVGEALGVSPDKVGPFALALECIHTYSLIHDDLPCMDDDNERRGQPTNHIRFSEATALLAGDALLTEAFYILAEYYPQSCGLLTKHLANGAGLFGMIRGQTLDLGKGKPVESLSDLIHLHELKTGCLIALAFVGPAILAGEKTGPMEDLGKLIGLAFQVKDDLLDADEDGELSFTAFLGVEATQQHLEMLTEKIHMKLSELNLKSDHLLELIQFNLNREN